MLRCRPIPREFSYESTRKKILKNSPHLPKLLTNKWHTFSRHSVEYTAVYSRWAETVTDLVFCK